MDEQNNIPEEQDYLKALENDHFTDSTFSLLDLETEKDIDLEKTQIFNSQDFPLMDFQLPEEPQAPVEEPAAEEAAPTEDKPAEEVAEKPAKPTRVRKPQTKSFFPKDALKNPRYVHEVILPLGIFALAAVLCVIFIIGSLSHVMKGKQELKASSIAASESQKAEEERLNAEAIALLLKASEAAEGYDFAGAIAILDSFEGDPVKYDIADARALYEQELQKTTPWSDPAQVLNLSFHVLVADAVRAYADDDFGGSYEDNFITTDEFSRILEQLYANDYILVNLTDLVDISVSQDVTVMSPRTLYLPAGKKPVVLTETNANYYTYMVDGNEDGIADKDGSGFASKLIVDSNGNIVNELIDANGNIVTGAFDMVPILEQFIAAHPDFSYGNARAVIAPSGYDGVFGYRIQASAKDALGEDAYAKEVAGAKQVANALREKGYIIGCYSYNNSDFDIESSASIQMDLMSWDDEIAPVIGKTNVMVFARNSDVGGMEPYSGEKFNAMWDAGYRYFLGVGELDTWAEVNKDYFHQFRLLITGERLVETPERYNGIFDASSVLNSAR